MKHLNLLVYIAVALLTATNTFAQDKDSKDYPLQPQCCQPI